MKPSRGWENILPTSNRPWKWRANSSEVALPECDLKSCWNDRLIKEEVDQTVRPVTRSLRGWSGEATDRSKPSDNVPTFARVASEPRGDDVSASIRWRGPRLDSRVRIRKCS